ncbi:hypothetical protein QQX98_005883 [Neonectria punicea]|uniref:RelA/SpoT domain-containing protein n=1 Tax=Neonectria punicea TaxID=979145 RepID=A0ABR1H366_9HYPO
MADDLINRFVQKYKTEHGFYVTIATLAEDRCRRVLDDLGIRAIVTSRAKDPSRVSAKLKMRMVKKGYQNEDDILNDLIDLAGVRVALYFPSQQLAAVKLLGENFNVRETKQHPEIATVQTPASGQSQAGDIEPAGDLVSSADTPYTNEFAGYRATHLRVELGDKVQDLPIDINVESTTAMIEIQVASLLMHAWSEVNHDLAYKTLNGTPSDGELRILDGINGLVRTGEVLLGQLLTSMVARMAHQKQPFISTLELRAFVQNFVPEDDPDGTKTHMGPLSWLYAVCDQLGIKSPNSLGPHLQRWKKESARPIEYSVVLSILDFIFNVVHDQQTVDPLVAPYLNADANGKFSAAGRTKQLAYLLNLLRYASTFEFNPRGLRDDAPSEFPEAHDTLKDKGLLNIFKRPGESLVVADEEADAFTKDIKDLWSWFATNENIVVRVALGMARVRLGSTL